MAVWPTWAHKQVIFNALGYRPYPEQEVIHQSAARVLQIVGGERAGKSAVSANEVASRSMTCERIAFVADEYTHSRKEFTYLCEALDILGWLGKTSTPIRGGWSGVTTLGCEFSTISVNTGVQQLTGTGEPFDIIVVCEAGLQEYNTFLAARGRVAETRGLILLSGTLWDNVGWYADMWKLGQKDNDMDLASFSLPTWANIRLFPGGKDDPEILAWRASLNDKDEEARRIDAKVLPSPARIYPQFSELTHVVNWAKFDPKGDVYLFVDSGYMPSKYAVLACQFRKDSYGRETMVFFDEIWENLLMHEQVIKRCIDREWWDNVVHIVGGHETKQHPAAESTAEVWAASSKVYMETFNAGLVREGNRRVRFMLNPMDELPPRIFVNPVCKGLIWEFKHYNRKQDRHKNVISDDPADKNNDAMDALRNGVVWRYGHFDIPESQKEKEPMFVNPVAR